MSQKEAQHMRLTLLENAIDFMLSAAEESQGETNRDLKYAILHLCNGIELLLKERLRREHWSLLFSDVDKADPVSLAAGDFTSVGFWPALNRVGKIAGLELNRKTLSLLKKIRDCRNRISHFAFEGNKDQVLGVVLRAWSWVLDFIHKELSDELTGALADEIENIKQLMSKNEKFVATRLSELEAELSGPRAEFLVSFCPECLQEALLLGDGDPRCLFCHFSSDPESTADAYASAFGDWMSPKDRMITGDSVRLCPECETYALVERYDATTGPNHVCFWCGISGSFEECPRCGELYDPGGKEDYMPMCGKCWKCLIQHD